MALLVHEYAHASSSLEDHGHDVDFYRRFHDNMMHPRTHDLADRMFRSYMRAVAKHQVQPSGNMRYHAEQMGGLAVKLKKRGKPSTS